jgi:hypothetical protein
VKQKVGLQLFAAVPAVKSQLHEAVFGVVLLNVTQSGAQPSAGEGEVVNVTTGKGLTVMVTVAVAGRLVQLSVTVTV